jgi:hypothetical protein
MPTDGRGRVEPASVDLYWLPLGAGGRSVRWNGRIFEAVVAFHEHRPARDLYHSALAVRVGRDHYVIEMTPVWGGPDVDRGVVCEGPVGARGLGRSRCFRYEVRCWLGGEIPDVAEAVASPQRLSADPARARRVLDLVPLVPSLTWGRDELGAGEMWNSNSLVSWLLVRSGHDLRPVRPPGSGRAPGWAAGLALANRQLVDGRLRADDLATPAGDPPGDWPLRPGESPGTGVKSSGGARRGRPGRSARPG